MINLVNLSHASNNNGEQDLSFQPRHVIMKWTWCGDDYAISRFKSMWRKPYQGRHDDSLSKVNDNNILVYIQLLSEKVKEYETLGS